MPHLPLFPVPLGFCSHGLVFKAGKTTGLPSLSPVQCRPQTTVRLLWGREALLPAWRPTRDAANSPVILVGGSGSRSPSCSFLHPALLGQLGAGMLVSLMAKRLQWRWIDPACCFREVLKGRFGSTMSDRLCPPQKSSSNVLCHSL